MSDDLLEELGKDLPWERPDQARREAVRSSLLVEASEGARPTAQRRWLVVGAAFATGALAAAAVAIVIVRDDHSPAQAPNPAQITASSEARLEHRVVTTATGVDEIVHVHDGKVRLAVEAVRAGDHVRLRTKDAEVEGAGEYEVVVVAEALSTVTVRSGTAQIKVNGQHTVLLSAGQTWRSSIITTDLSPSAPSPPDRVAVADSLDGRPVVNSDSKPAVPDTATHAVRPSDAGRSTVTSGGHPSDSSSIRGADTDIRSEVAATGVRRADSSTRISGTTARGDQTAAGASDFANKLSGVRDADKPAARQADQGVQQADKGVQPDKRVQQADKDNNVQSADNGVPADKPVGSQSTIERHFQTGWALLRSGKAREAAVELGAAAAAAPDDPLATDARYFQAVALVRAGQRPEAERVLVQFLDTAPRSLRRGRAAVMLGRLIGERGDLASARAWLESAVSDPEPAIASAARAGLDALAAPSARP